eukprot:7007605-Prymnesium_polylepis.1
MSREPTLEVGGCLLTRHRPLVRRVTHTQVSKERDRPRALPVYLGKRPAGFGTGFRLKTIETESRMAVLFSTKRG